MSEDIGGGAELKLVPELLSLSETKVLLADF